MIVCVCVDKREQVDKSCLPEKACVLVQTQARSFVRSFCSSGRGRAVSVTRTRRRCRTGAYHCYRHQLLLI